MKFLIIQENGRHEGNREYRECFCLQRALYANKQECDVWGLGHPNYTALINFNSYDIILNIENYDSGWIPDLSTTAPKPFKMLWSIDAHCRGITPYLQEFQRGKYNIILQSTKDFCDNNSVWFPNAYDNTLIKPLPLPRRADIGFCGNVLNRKPYLDFIASKYNFVSDIFVIGDDMVKAINSYLIHFNMNIANDINYRNFETLGCGVLLLTNFNPQYQELGFRDMENCVFYTDIQNLDHRILFLLNNPLKLGEIRQKGLELASKHTYNKRIEHLLKYLKTKI